MIITLHLSKCFLLTDIMSIASNSCTVMADPRNLDFSNLPTPLLSIIISSLPFKEAARTSVLSKPWKHIWFSTTNIEFNESFFVKPEISGEEKYHRRRVFLNFMQQWIQMHSQPVTDTQPAAYKFRLSLSNPRNHLVVVAKCIGFVARRKVKNLDLDFSDPSWSDRGDYRVGSLRIILNDFGNELESLRLFSCNFAFSTPMSYIALKSLSLGWIKLNLASLKSLIAACRSLESLSLVKCWGLDYIQISEVPRLKRLVLDKCQVDLQKGILVEARNMQFLKYSGRFVPFDLEYLRNLDEVVLDFGIETEYHEDGELLFNLLTELWSTRVLTVCSYSLKAIQSAEDSYISEPELWWLEHLILKASLREIEYYGISFFLNSCPSLEVLTIHMSPLTGPYFVRPPCRMGVHPFLMEEEENATKFKCLRESLRVVEVMGYRGYPSEQRVLRYLIRHGIVLKDMFIHLSDTKGCQILERRECFLLRAQMLQELPRASPYLHISII